MNHEEKATSALLVDPSDRSVYDIRIAGYVDIKQLFPETAQLEGNSLCQYQGPIYLQTWGDCNDFLEAPAWRSLPVPQYPMHGLTVVCAFDLTTGEGVDCPIPAAAFAKAIEWEDYEDRREMHRPNKEWADKVGGYRWSVGDGEKETAGGSAWEDAR